MRLGILCASKLALPSLYFLSQQGVQLQLILPNQREPEIEELEFILQQGGVPYQKWDKKEITNLNSWAILNQLDHLWVMTFPYIIPKKVLESIPIPVLNFHFAPLPNYRGAQPVFWMIKNREKRGGISIHIMTSEIDAGSIVHFEPYAIKEHETFGSYMSSVAQLNVLAIQQLFAKLQNKNWHVNSSKQKESEANYFKSPDLADILIHWDEMTSDEIEALCRACNPWNKGAMTNLNGQVFKLIEVEIIEKQEHLGEEAGEIVYLEKEKCLAISTSDTKYLRINIASYADEGFFSNVQLQKLGFTKGLKLQS